MEQPSRSPGLLAGMARPLAEVPGGVEASPGHSAGWEAKEMPRVDSQWLVLITPHV